MNAIDKRRTVRDFDPRPVPEAALKRALEAGLKAPSYNHLKDWHFLLVRDGRKRLELTATETMQETVDPASFAGADELAKAMYLEAVPKQRRMILEAPELLVVAFAPKTAVVEAKRVYDLNCLASVWCCIENILLALAEEDLFGVTFIPKNTPGVKAVLGIPGELEVAAFIPLGYAAAGARILPQKAVSVEERLHIDRW
jgi:nitroreductase